MKTFIIIIIIIIIVIIIKLIWTKENSEMQSN